MPLNCPHCGIAQAAGTKICINCGQPLTPSSAASAHFVGPAPPTEAALAPHLADQAGPALPDPVHAIQAQRASWRLPAMVAVGLLFALAASALFVAQRKSAVRAALPAQASLPRVVTPAPTDIAPLRSAPLSSAPLPPLVLAPSPAPKAVARASTPSSPLTVTLASTREGRHVKVGDAVTFTAFTASAQDKDATLTLFSRRGHEKEIMFSFAQGSLCSTTWTPTAPGRYEFTATALDDHRRAASRRVEVTVDRPTPLQVGRTEAPKASPRVAAAPVPRRPALLLLPRTLSPRTLSPRTRSPKALPPRPAPRAKPPAPALTYHVAAAQFYFSRSAVVLADALTRRGYSAAPERMADRHGKTVYVVVTGSYRRPKEARIAVLALQRSGYPAYLFGSR